jgi:Predicted membrane protein (DUF2232)
MAQILLIGVGAGAAAGLLFASAAALVAAFGPSGAPVSILFVLLAPLPITIVTLGWSHWAGLIAVAIAAAGLVAAADTPSALFFPLAFGLPSWWLGYLALLARGPADDPTPEWYPVGRLVLWAAIVGAAVVIAAIPLFGSDQETFQAALRTGFEQAFRDLATAQSDAPLPGISDPQALVELLVRIAPPGCATFLAFTHVVDLWFAGHVVKTSGRLRRPWPDVEAMKFPSYTPLLLAAAVGGSFMSGLTGTISGVLTSALLLAYAVLGFAVLHAISRAMAGRAVVIGGAYVLVVVFVWPMLVMTLLGLADAAFDLRGRVAAKRGPPAARNL